LRRMGMRHQPYPVTPGAIRGGAWRGVGWAIPVSRLPCPYGVCADGRCEGMVKRLIQNRPNRRSIRLPDYDYTQPGAYFVTIVTWQRAPLFGVVEHGEMKLNPLGQIAYREWFKLVKSQAQIALNPEEFVVMPNHIHGIIWKLAGGTHPVQMPAFGRPIAGSLGTWVGQYKSSVTASIRNTRYRVDHLIWQRNYFDHIIRNERDLSRIRQYIAENPFRWIEDCYHSTVPPERLTDE